MTTIGVMILSAFAAIWWIVGIHASGHSSPFTDLLAIAITIVLVYAGVRTGRHVLREDAEDKRRDRVVVFASIAEGIAILLAVIVLDNIGRHDLIVCAIAIIVGLHFFPLAAKLPARSYYGTAVALILLGIAGLGIPAVDLRLLTVSAGAAIILWVTSVTALMGIRGAITRGRTHHPS